MPDPFKSFTSRKKGQTKVEPREPAPEGTMEKGYEDELKQVKEFFRASDARTKAAVDFNADGAFFTCVVFPTEAHRDAFLDAVQAVSFWEDDPQYIDGMELAKFLRIKMPTVPSMPRPEAGKGWRGVPIIT